MRHLVETIGTREAGSAGFRKAANYAADQFKSFGYTVTRQTIPLPAGESQGVAVPEGETQNVIKPPGYDPKKPHLLVGGHLDTVAVTPGANDNGSGSAVLLELARVASITRPVMPTNYASCSAARSGAGRVWGERRSAHATSWRT